MLIKESSSTSGGQFVNIRDGKLVVKNKDGQMESYASIKGTIFKVEFIEEEFKGKKYEKAKIFLKSDGQNYILQMRTDSGYFRGFCNSLKSSVSPKSEMTISPNSKDGENGKSQTTCFISQDGKFLKHFFTKDFSGDENDFLPPLEKIEFKGEFHYDNTKQIEYWKKWLSSKFQEQEQNQDTPPDSLFEENDDDLPF